MAIKHGQILTVGNSFVVARIQTGGPTNLNIPQTKVYELGNFNAVATIRDIPDLSYDIQSVDVTTDGEALLLRKDPASVNVGDQLDFGSAVPLDVISPFKAATNLYNIVAGIAIPWLTLENVTYRFGLKANAEQTFTVRGDSVFYIPGTPYYEEFAFSGGGVYTLSHTALTYVEEGVTEFVLAVCWVDATSGTSGRLFHTLDYTDTATTLTLNNPTVVPATAKVCVIYGSATAATYPQSVNIPAGAVKPGAIRSRDIDIYIGPQNGTLTRWTSVQSFEATRRVNLQNDEEFGNPHYVSQDYDTADVTGNIVVRPKTPQELVQKVQQIAGETNAAHVVGTLSAVPLEMEARPKHPDTGAILKTIYVPDARFTPPALQGRVQQRTDVTFPYTSDEGLIYVYKGARP